MKTSSLPGPKSSLARRRTQDQDHVSVGPCMPETGNEITITSTLALGSFCRLLRRPFSKDSEHKYSSCCGLSRFKGTKAEGVLGASVQQGCGPEAFSKAVSSMPVPPNSSSSRCLLIFFSWPNRVLDRTSLSAAALGGRLGGSWAHPSASRASEENHRKDSAVS